MRAPFGAPRRVSLKACFSQLGLLRQQRRALARRGQRSPLRRPLCCPQSAAATARRTASRPPRARRRARARARRRPAAPAARPRPPRLPRGRGRRGRRSRRAAWRPRRARRAPAASPRSARRGCLARLHASPLDRHQRLCCAGCTHSAPAAAPIAVSSASARVTLRSRSAEGPCLSWPWRAHDGGAGGRQRGPDGVDHISNSRCHVVSPSLSDAHMNLLVKQVLMPESMTPVARGAQGDAARCARGASASAHCAAGGTEAGPRASAMVRARARRQCPPLLATGAHRRGAHR